MESPANSCHKSKYLGDSRTSGIRTLVSEDKRWGRPRFAVEREITDDKPSV